MGWNKSFTVLDQEGCRGLSKIVAGLELEIYRTETRVTGPEQECCRTGAKEWQGCNTRVAGWSKRVEGLEQKSKRTGTILLLGWS
jgi:hypothetical protein